MNAMKYIMFDLDDTLLNDRREITPYTVQVLQKLQAMGHKLVYNTARSKDFVQKYFAILPPDYAILNGGAMIMNAAGETVWLSELDVPTARALLRELVGLTDAIYVQTVEEFFSHKGRKSFQPHICVDFTTEEFCQSAQKIVTDIAEDEKAAELAEKFGLAYTTYLGGTFRRYSNPGATKALGSRKLMELTGGSLADVIAFGDDLGDLDMLREAGVGVLMKNAREQLHGQTSHISSFTNDEDGVAKFLEEYFKI
jgi:Cof subfamily protein (haloacid dehalogenase superfamily)